MGKWFKSTEFWTQKRFPSNGHTWIMRDVQLTRKADDAAHHVTIDQANLVIGEDGDLVIDG